MSHRAKIANRFVILISRLIPVLLLGCGGPVQLVPVPSRLLVVVDANNNRVLLYDSPFSTGESASVVLGQSSFTAFGFGATATTMDNPVGVAVDATGNLYLTDQNNCRILKFPSPFTTGMAATLALGQLNLVTGTCLNSTFATAFGLGNSPGGVAIDASGDVWVADSYYSRIVEYPAPLAAGEAATVALGQHNLTSAGAFAGCNQAGTPAADTLCFPGGLAFDAAGNLWVADNGNNRILMYPKANLVTGGSAFLELGQPPSTAFTSNTPNNGGISASSLSLGSFRMAGLAFDSSANLWVADINNNRVLMYPKASLGLSGAAATLELGQPSGTAFTSNTPNNPTPGGSTFFHPIGLAFDGTGDLVVGDSVNNRTLVFTAPFSNGMSAGLVVGQTDLSSTSGTTTSTGQNGPVGVTTAP